MVLTLTASIMYWSLQQPEVNSTLEASVNGQNETNSTLEASIDGENKTVLADEVSNLAIDNSVSEKTDTQ